MELVVIAYKIVMDLEWSQKSLQVIRIRFWLLLHELNQSDQRLGCT